MLFDRNSFSVSYFLLKDSLNGFSFFMCCAVFRLFSCVVTLLTVACQASLSMEFSGPEYWSGEHSLLQGIFPTDPGIKSVSPVSPALQADFLPAEPLGKPYFFDGLNVCC